MPNFSAQLEKLDIGGPYLYAISDLQVFPSLSPETYQALLFRVPAAVIQWREKHLSIDRNRPLIQSAAGWSRQSGKLLIVNTEVQTALQVGAAGAHLTSVGDLDEALRLRRQMGREEDFVIGKSVHSLQEAVAAESAGADYVMLGPIADPISKPGYAPPLGRSALREAVQMLSIPVVAVGGVEDESLDWLFSTGIVAAAGISWVRREIERLLA